MPEVSSRSPAVQVLRQVSGRPETGSVVQPQERKVDDMRLPAIALLAAMAATPSAANEFAPAMQAFLDGEILAWSQSDEIVSAIRDQNDRNADMDQALIDELDLTWRAEIGASATPTIDPVLENATAEFLRDRVSASAGRITEIFIMDRHGLNVAASALTSDMWQGDEEKFTETYSIGPGAVHFSEVELDESTQRYQAQISVTIVDPETGDPIGAMTIGVDAEALL
jgi:hypothetical protein